MGDRNFIKAGSITGFIAGCILTPFIVLAPNDHPIKTGRMLFPKSSMPRTENISVTPPTSAKVMRVLVVTIFLGPFGALAGGGVGMLLTGLLQKPPKNPPDDPV